MDWEYTCCRCGKGYCVMHPDPYGFPNICRNCWTDNDANKLANYLREEDKRKEEYLSSVKLEKIPLWIRKLFGAL